MPTLNYVPEFPWNALYLFYGFVWIILGFTLAGEIAGRSFKLLSGLSRKRSLWQIAAGIAVLSLVIGLFWAPETFSMIECINAVSGYFAVVSSCSPIYYWIKSFRIKSRGVRIACLVTLFPLMTYSVYCCVKLLLFLLFIGF